MRLPAGARALAHRDFRLFWGGQLVSLVGTWMQSVGQSWLVLELTGSPLRLGLINGLQFAPMLVVSLVGGVLSDRVAKRRVLLATQGALMCQALTLAALTGSGHVRYWHVAVLAGLYGVAAALDMPARQAYLVHLVGRGDLMSAIALNSAVFNGARVAGPAAAGLLVARFGPAAAFLANGLSFLAVIVALLAVRTEGEARPRAGGGFRQEIAEGIRYALGTPRVALVLALLGSVSLFVINFGVLVPLIARNVLGEGVQGFGFLMTALGGGAVAGALGLAATGARQPRLRLVVGAALALSGGTALLGGVRHFEAAAALLALIGFCQIIFTAGCNTTLQVMAPDELRGRVMGLYALVFVGVAPFGAFLVGSVAQAFGVPAACAVAGGAGLVSVAALALGWRRRGGLS